MDTKKPDAYLAFKIPADPPPKTSDKPVEEPRAEFRVKQVAGSEVEFYLAKGKDDGSCRAASDDEIAAFKSAHEQK